MSCISFWTYVCIQQARLCLMLTCVYSRQGFVWCLRVFTAGKVLFDAYVCLQQARLCLMLTCVYSRQCFVWCLPVFTAGKALLHVFTAGFVWVFLKSNHPVVNIFKSKMWHARINSIKEKIESESWERVGNSMVLVNTKTIFVKSHTI